MRVDKWLQYPDNMLVRRHPITGLFKTTLDERYGSPLLPVTDATVGTTTRTDRPNDSHQGSATALPFASDPSSFIFQCAPTESDDDDDEAYKVFMITCSKAKETAAPSSSCPAAHFEHPGEGSGHIATRHYPAYTNKLKAATPDAAKKMLDVILDMPVGSTTVRDLLAVSPDLQKEIGEYMHTYRVPIASTMATMTVTPPVPIEYSMPLRELKVMINGTQEEIALLDEGSEIVVIREDIWRKMNTFINPAIKLKM